MNHLPNGVIAYRGNTDPFYPYIYKIQIFNLMNFKKFELKPTHGINFIFGPNGCGKSSILIAVRLALGSTPEECERGHSYADYVNTHKPNDEKAFITIGFHVQNQCFTTIRSLDPDDHNDKKFPCVLRCNLDLLSGEHKLVFGDIVITEREKIVTYLKESFHIDTNNLFQILPQEKISRLLTTDYNQNLLNIEKALQYELFQQHTSLIQKAKELADMAKEINQLSGELLKLDSQMTKCQEYKDVESKKKEYDNKIKDMENIMVWAKYNDAKNAFRHELKCHQDLSTTDLIEQKIQGYNEELTRLQIEKDSYQDSRKYAEFTNLRRETNRLFNYVSDTSYRVRTYDTDIKTAHDKLEREEDLLREKETRLATLQNLPQQSNNDLKSKVENLKLSINDVTSEERKLSDMINKLKSEISPLDSQIRERKDAINSLVNKTYSLVSNDTKICIEHIKKTSFSKPIYAPVYQYIGVETEEIAVYLQSSLGFYTQCGILCTSDEDGTAVRKYARDNNLRRVGIFTVTKTGSKPLDISVLKNADVGITSTLDTYISYPRLAKEVPELLCRESGINNILIADNTFDMNKFSKFLQTLYNDRTPIKKPSKTIDIRSLNSLIVLTSQFKVIFNRIRGNRISIQTEPFRLNTNCRLILPGIFTDKAKIEKQIIDLEKQQVEKSQKKQESDSRMCELSKLKDKYKTEFNNLQRVLTDSRHKEASLTQLQKDIQSQTTAIADMKMNLAVKTSADTIPNLLRNQVAKITEISTLCSKMEVSIIGELIESRVKYQISAIQNSVAKENENLLKIQSVRRNCLTKLQQTEKRMESALQAAQNVMALRTDPIPLKDCPCETKSYVSYKLPDSVKEFDLPFDELERTYNGYKYSRKTLTSKSTNDNSRYDYTTLLARTAQCKDQKWQLEDSLRRGAIDIVELNKKWHLALQEQIKKMDLDFNDYLSKDHRKKMGYITLEPSEFDSSINALDYIQYLNQYKLRIQAKLPSFDSVRDLSGNDLSGGERAFSTALFLLSMRSLVQAPFCMMDEINQGMDENYEYEFFKLLMNGKQYTQYFIFSPTQNMKIEDILCELKNEKYRNTLLTMHVILSGDYVAQVGNDNIISFDNEMAIKRQRESLDYVPNKRIKVNS